MSHEDLEITLDKELEELILLEAVENEVNNELICNEPLNKDEKTVKHKKKKRKRKIASKKLRNGLKVRTVVLLLLTLIVNTYAWFIYISTVTMGVDVHVKSWKIDFMNDDSQEEFDLILDEVYPGMPDATQEITAKNSGEMDATLSCKIVAMQIFDEKFAISDEYEGTVITEEEILNKLKEYPFDIKIALQDNDITEVKEVTVAPEESIRIKLNVVWSYETGETETEILDNDKKDTDYGIKAYEYYEANKGQEGSNYCIKITVKLEAVQKGEEAQNP